MAREMTFVAANPELERRAKAAFDDVVDLPTEARMAAIARACGDDASLRTRVESLLAAHDHAENFLDPPPALFGFDLDADFHAGNAQPSSASDYPLIGQRIARYRVLRRLGAGGMGVVYLAEQEQPRRTVALKVMRAGLASRSMLRRFEHEAEVLGHLKHPGIAQIFEAGTFDVGHGAQPYFAMEFIDGPTITAFAKSHALDARARLELIAQMCDAIHHAHQKGVVHRDLKPDNVLIQEEGIEAPRHQVEDPPRRGMKGSVHAMPRTKVLDFGVARLTDSDFAVTTLKTDIGQIVGTLPYMSPEQVAADPSQVDVRSDVYALGVITYELLTGSVPFDVRHKSMAEAARIIVDHEPPSLTSFDRVFRGDVSTIVGKALEKDKTRRYQSASDLGEDIRRYLRHEPISARPATTMYQLRKFARRNKALVAGAMGIVLMLMLGVIGTSVGMLQARASARIAQKQELAAEKSAIEAGRQRAAAEQVSRFLQQMLGSINPAIAQGRDTALLREILASASQRVDRELADQPDIAATLHGVIGRTYASIADYAPAEQHLRTALDLRVKLFGEQSIEAAQARGDLGRVLHNANRFADAQPLLEQALATTQSLLGPSDPATARAMNDLANLRRSRGAYDEAERMLVQVRAMLEAQGVAPDDASMLRATNDLANVLLTRRKFAQALPLFQSVLDARLRTATPDSPDLALAEANISRALVSLSRNDEALPHMQHALAIHRKVLPPGHGTLVSTMLGMANLEYKRQNWEQAEALMNEASQTSAATFGAESSAVANVLAMQCSLAEARQDLAAANRLAQAALDMRRKTLPPDHPDIAASLRQLSSLRGTQSRPEEALALLQQALEIQRIHGASDYDACESMLNLATYEYMYGDISKAVTLARDAQRMLSELLGDKHPAVTSAKSRIAKFLTEQQLYDEALALRLDVLARERDDPHYEMLEIAGAADEAGSVLLLMGRFDEAEPLLRESLELRRRELPMDHFAPGRSLIRLGACLVGQRKFEEAERVLLEGEAIWSKQSNAAPLTKEARRSLIELYEASGRTEEAAAWTAKLQATLNRRDRATSQPATTTTSQPQS